MDTDLKQLEHEVTASMRTALANLETDRSLVSEKMYAAHDLFSEHLLEWPEDFCSLYNQMLEIYRAHTPKPRGHYRNTHIGIGYSSFPISRWITDKEQPPIPTSDELVGRFDRLISAYTSSEKAAVTPAPI